MTYSVPPQPKSITPYVIKVGETRWFEIIGSGFKSTTNIYLSGHPLESKSKSYDPFGLFPAKTSVKYPPIMAVKLSSCTEWGYDDDSTIMFVMPSANCPGFVDVIIENPAGYGKLTENVRINVYPTGTFPPPSFVPYQLPFLSGIQVIDPGNTTYVAPITGYILLETSIGYLLQENNDKLILDYLISKC